MSTYDKASLVLIPSGTKTGKIYSQKPINGDGDFSFSRSTSATRVNQSGLIEKETGNLLNYSNDFSESAWVNTDVSVTGGQAGYDGSSDAWLLTKFTGGAFSRNAQGLSTSGVQVFSIYAKANTLTWIRLLGIGSSNNPYAYYDLTNGVLGTKHSSVIDFSIESIGNGWYRCDMVFNEVLSEVRIYPVTGDGDFSTAGSIYIQDAQLEQGLVARDYIETTTSAVYGGITDNVPRIDYTDASCPSLLLEPTRTNIVLISEGVPEDTNEVTLTENYGTSPEGVQNSLKVQKNGITANDRILPIDNYNATLVSGNEYTISCFVKNIDVTGVTTIACRVSGGSLFRRGFEWDGNSLSIASTFGSGNTTNVFVEDYGNDWWRIGFTFVADGTNGNFEIDVDRENGSDTTSIETWGWQFEEGSFKSSYIPTYGTSVTRNEDIGVKVENLYTKSITEENSPYSVFFDLSSEPVLNVTSGNSTFITIANGETMNDTFITIRKYYSTQDGKIRFYSNIDGRTIDYVTTINKKYVISVNGNVIKGYSDGALKFTETMETSHNGLGSFKIQAGSSFRTQTQFSNIMMFKSILTDQEAINLTTT
jgi:hypothetical protein